MISLIRVVTVCLSLSLLAGCARFEFNPAVYEKKKFALVTFFGNKQVNAATGAIGSTQGAASEWGTEFLTGYFEDGVKDLQDTIGGEFIGADQVVLAPSYASLKGPTFEFNQLAAGPLKPINVSSPDLPGLGKLGAELQVDAVVLMQHEWVILADANTEEQYSNDKYRLLIVAADGTKLWDLVGDAEGRTPLTLKQALNETVGAVSPDTMKELIRSATDVAMNTLEQKWKSNRR